MSDLKGSAVSPVATQSASEAAADKQFAEVEGLTSAANEKNNSGGYVLDATQLGTAGQSLQTAFDSRTILIPQPSSDPNDPLNWSIVQKHLILFTVAIVAFLPDFASSIAIVTVLPQAKQWKVSQNTMERIFSDNLFCLAAGSILSVSLSAYFGRLPILVLFTAIALATSAWCAAATSPDSFKAARVLNGLFAIVAQAGGLMYIQDIFFFHEHPRKINIWSGAVIISPHLGPLITAFLVYYKSWPDAFWVSTGLSALCLLLVLVFMDETMYNRGLHSHQQPIPRSRALRLVGIEQWRSRHSRQTFLQACMRPIIAISKLPVLLCTIFYFLNFSWIIGTNASISIFLTRDYHFTTFNLGMFYFSPIIGSLLGTLLGHWLHDLVGSFYVARHSGKIEPEARLIIIWLASPIMSICILIVGFALKNVWHWSIVAVFFAGQVMGINIATVAINAYLLDAYPEGSGEVGALITVGRATGGCMATYIQLDWVARSGLLHTFGTQTGITTGSALIIAGLGIWGKCLRMKQGQMAFAMKTGYE